MIFARDYGKPNEATLPRTQRSPRPSRSTPSHALKSRPHPEEPRVARRLEGWAAARMLPTLRDAAYRPLLRVRLGVFASRFDAGSARPTPALGFAPELGRVREEQGCRLLPGRQGTRDRNRRSRGAEVRRGAA